VKERAWCGHQDGDGMSWPPAISVAKRYDKRKKKKKRENWKSSVDIKGRQIRSAIYSINAVILRHLGGMRLLVRWPTTLQAGIDAILGNRLQGSRAENCRWILLAAHGV
jgi:hypothetical protein